MMKVRVALSENTVARHQTVAGGPLRIEMAVSGDCLDRSTIRRELLVAIAEASNSLVDLARIVEADADCCAR